MKDDYNARLYGVISVRGRWLKHDLFTHETYFNGRWYADDEREALVEAVERDNYIRDEAAEDKAEEARMTYNDMRRSAGETD